MTPLHVQLLPPRMLRVQAVTTSGKPVPEAEILTDVAQDGFYHRLGATNKSGFLDVFIPMWKLRGIPDSKRIRLLAQALSHAESLRTVELGRAENEPEAVVIPMDPGFTMQGTLMVTRDRAACNVPLMLISTWSVQGVDGGELKPRLFRTDERGRFSVPGRNPRNISWLLAIPTLEIHRALRAFDYPLPQMIIVAESSSESKGCLGKIHLDRLESLDIEVVARGGSETPSVQVAVGASRKVVDRIRSESRGPLEVGPSAPSVEFHTNSRGRLRLLLPKVVSIRLTARIGQRRQRANRQLHIPVPLSDESMPLRIRFEDLILLRGRVLDDTGEPMPEAFVTVLPRPLGLPFIPADHSGRFRFLAKPGNYWLTAVDHWSKNYRPSSATRLRLGSEPEGLIKLILHRKE